MRLTSKNYYSPEANREWMSVSQFKRFLECEAAALADLNGEYKPERGRALLLGSYVDEMLTGTKKSQAKFIEENHSELFKKNDDKYADIVQADEAIERVKAQPLMMKYLGGRHQKIFTGKIGGVPFRGKLDAYKKGEFISDLKYLKSLRSPNLFENVLDYWKYPLQMAVYQELVFQKTGERLPCYIVIVTKESPAHVAICEIDQFTLDENLELVKKLAPKFQAIKNGEIETERCEEYGCDWCALSKVITEPIPYEQLGMSSKQLKAMKGEL